METPEFYTTSEAAQLLKVTQRTLYNYIDSGKLEASKTAANQWRISRDSVLRFLGLPDAPAESFNDETLTIAKAAIGE